ncbi:hypothetical protein B0T24DRAFT_684532 [Lasiosphaeria ovina]|uniref:Uncharacterized protein n=1 Tax=Lasiosphaeria ovina TaxID=92902 RepID=A0AAE0JU34_9PEZI|nr:hypothetical protein B0T24DRAFT_684532 [Lasiosphaeria ovina]
MPHIEPPIQNAQAAQLKETALPTRQKSVEDPPTPVTLEEVLAKAKTGHASNGKKSTAKLDADTMISLAQGTITEASKRPTLEPTHSGFLTPSGMSVSYMIRGGESDVAVDILHATTNDVAEAAFRTALETFQGDLSQWTKPTPALGQLALQKAGTIMWHHNSIMVTVHAQPTPAQAPKLAQESRDQPKPKPQNTSHVLGKPDASEISAGNNTNRGAPTASATHPTAREYLVNFSKKLEDHLVKYDAASHSITPKPELKKPGPIKCKALTLPYPEVELVSVDTLHEVVFIKYIAGQEVLKHMNDTFVNGKLEFKPLKAGNASIQIYVADKSTLIIGSVTVAFTIESKT